MKKILIIEDDPQLQQFYKDTLTAEGYTVATAFTADDGLQSVKNDKPDLILLDIMLPNGKNGFDVLELLKKDEQTKSIAVIVMTNLDSEKNTALQIGAVDYIVKANAQVEDIVKKVKVHAAA